MRKPPFHKECLRRWTEEQTAAVQHRNSKNHQLSQHLTPECEVTHRLSILPLRRGKSFLGSEPRAVSARYDRKTGRVTVELVNGCAYMFPTHRVQGLAEASPDDLETVTVDGVGFNPHWPRLDADLYVPPLVAGVFGTRDWMRKALARQAGRTTSPAKAAAARANGSKGGRPRKHA